MQRTRLSIQQPFIHHLLELRSRLIWIVLSLLIGSSIGYYLYDRILFILLLPLHKPVYYSTPGGGFDFVIKLSLFFGMLLSLPVGMYQLLKFLEPAMPKQSTRNIPLLLISSCLLMVGGVTIAYLVGLPVALQFLNEFGSKNVQSLISTDAYFTFVTHYLLGFGILFQIPIVLLVINSIKPLPTNLLLKYQRYVIVLSFIIAMILNPTPDPFTQTIMALPIIFLYYVSILLVAGINSRKSNKRKSIPTAP